MAGTGKPSLKVVARLRNGKVVKGFVDTIPASDFNALLQEPHFSLPREIPLRSTDSNKTEFVTLDSLKALFFVKTFEGTKEYKEMKFFEKNPAIKGLWVRVKFFDNEHIEGVVRNSIQYLVEPGFFLKPPDLQSNNEILYVVKNSLADFRVLGVSSEY